MSDAAVRAALGRVSLAARRAEEARRRLRETIRAARAAGASTREIAAVAGVSHTQVRRLLAE